MKRGEIWWADLPLSAGRRPIVLLSRDEAYTIRSQITVCPVTTRVRHLPVEVALGTKNGLEKPSVINLDYLLTIPKDFLDKKIGRLSSQQGKEMDLAIKFSLGLDE